MPDDDFIAGKPAEQLRIVTLFTLLGRLKLFFAFVEQSLRTEYIHSSKTVEDWLFTLDWLDDSLFPAYEFFREASDDQAVDLRSKKNRVEFFKNLLADARNALLNPELSPVSKLYRLLDAIVRFHGGVALWQQELQRNFPDCDMGSSLYVVKTPPRSLAPSALRMLSRLMEEFGVNLLNEDGLAICMTSRKIFLLLYYTMAVHPEEWHTRLQEQILRQHDVAIRKLPMGKASKSIKSRRDKLREYDVTEFTRVAMSAT